MNDTELKAKLNREKLPESYRELFDLLRNHVDDDNVCMNLVYEIASHYGGQQVYFKKRDELLRATRNTEILNEFTGFNHAALARRFNLAITTIYDIIEEERIRRQGQLF